MLHRTGADLNRERAARRATAGELMLFGSLSLAAAWLASGCSGSTTGADDGAALCPGDAGCVDASAPDDVSAGELPSPAAEGIVAKPNPMDFGNVQPGSAMELTLKLTNTGSAPATLTGFRLTGHTEFILHGLQPDDSVGWSAATAAEGITFPEPMRLEPADSRSLLTVTFRPLTVGTAIADLTLLSDATPSELSIPLRGSAGLGSPKQCLSELPNTVDFGCVPTGATYEWRGTLSACDAEVASDLRIDRLGLSGKPGSRFALDLTGLPRGDAGPMPGGASQVSGGDPPIVIPAGTSAKFRVTYVAGKPYTAPTFGGSVRDSDEIRLSAVGYSEQLTLPLRGAGFDPACPTRASIAVKEGGGVALGTPLHLRAMPAFSCGSVPPFYSWTVTQPAGSTASLLPGPFSETPTFTASQAGAYVFGLTVLDSAGHAQCAPASTTVYVGNSADLSVQLTWTTPGDVDPTDDGPNSSADLDLHFLHPDAEGFDINHDGKPDGWFDALYDCFWFNTDPKWGTPDPNVDNGPHLKVDQPGGTQSESLTMTPLMTQRRYKIGVHAWNDHGFGPSLATVRVRIGGNVAYEVKDVSLNNLDMWEVATIDWPVGDVTPLLLPDGAHKILPDYSSDLFPAP